MRTKDVFLMQKRLTEVGINEELLPEVVDAIIDVIGDTNYLSIALSTNNNFNYFVKNCVDKGGLDLFYDALYFYYDILDLDTFEYIMRKYKNFNDVIEFAQKIDFNEDTIKRFTEVSYVNFNTLFDFTNDFEIIEKVVDFVLRDVKALKLINNYDTEKEIAEALIEFVLNPYKFKI